MVVSFIGVAVDDATELALDRPLCRYALKWCKSNNDDDDDVARG